MNSSIGLYIHIPFCAKKCNYCNFYSIPAGVSMYDEYVDILQRSIAEWAGRLTDRCVDTVYFGGGTPSQLGTKRLLRILNSVTQSFSLAENSEITAEINPFSQDELDFRELKKSGFNRFSIGMQSIIPEELRILGRLHKDEDVKKTIENLSNAGIDNFSLDVMQGIPLQTPESLRKTLEFCVNSGASHISTYMLKIEKGTPFYKNAENLVFPDDDTAADYYELTCEYLKSYSFRHYEISNFCKDDKISRHNMKYWELEDYLGIGPSAHSLIDGKRFYYPADLDSFSKGEILFESEGKTPEEFVMLSLRTDRGLSFQKFKELFNTSLPQHLLAEAEKLKKLDLLNMTEDCILLTEKGYLLSNIIIAKLISKGI